MSSIINKVKSHLKGQHHDTTPVVGPQGIQPTSYGNSSYSTQSNVIGTQPVSYGTTSYGSQMAAPQSTVFVNPHGPAAGNLHQTYHHEDVLSGPRPDTLVHKQEDRWEGGNLNQHESVVRKETIIEPKVQKPLPRAAPLPVVPLAHPIAPAPVVLEKTTRAIIEPTVTKSVVEKPVIVKETLLPEERIEIQPVIHREREQKEIHKVVQPLHEKDILPTKVVQATLAKEVRAPIIESDAGYQARSREADSRFASTKEYASLKSQTVQKPAIVEEHVHKTIIEEVQPILYKETVVPVIIQETQPIYETIVEAPIVMTEERAMRDLGTQFASTSVSDRRIYEEGRTVIAPQSFVQKTTVTETVIPSGLNGDKWTNPALYQKNPTHSNINNTRLV